MLDFLVDPAKSTLFVGYGEWYETDARILEVVHVEATSGAVITYVIVVGGSAKGYTNDRIVISVFRLRQCYVEGLTANELLDGTVYRDWPFAVSFMPSHWTQGPLPVLVLGHLIRHIKTGLPELWDYLEKADRIESAFTPDTEYLNG